MHAIHTPDQANIITEPLKIRAEIVRQIDLAQCQIGLSIIKCRSYRCAIIQHQWLVSCFDPKSFHPPHPLQ